jgi:hypothetical protein
MEQKPSTSSIPNNKQLPPIIAGHSSLFNKAKTAAMSRISGVQRLRTNQFGQGIPSEFGVTCKKEIEVYMQRVCFYYNLNKI